MTVVALIAEEGVVEWRGLITDSRTWCHGSFRVVRYVALFVICTLSLVALLSIVQGGFYARRLYKVWINLTTLFIVLRFTLAVVPVGCGGNF